MGALKVAMYSILEVYQDGVQENLAFKNLESKLSVRFFNEFLLFSLIFQKRRSLNDGCSIASFLLWGTESTTFVFTDF